MNSTRTFFNNGERPHFNNDPYSQEHKNVYICKPQKEYSKDEKKVKTHKNKYAAIDLKSLNTILYTAKAINQENKALIESKQEIWAVIQEVLKETKSIHSTNLPTDDPIDATMVLLVQNKSYSILKSVDMVEDMEDEGSKLNIQTEINKSLMGKIFKVAELAKKYEAGNCQEKSFYAFKLLIQKFIKHGLSNLFNSISIELVYFSNHFALIVDNLFLVDPLFGICFPCPKGEKTLESIYKGFGSMERYFVLKNDWNCYFKDETNNLFFDQYSTLSTHGLFNNGEFNVAKSDDVQINSFEPEDTLKTNNANGYDKVEKQSTNSAYRFNPY